MTEMTNLIRSFAHVRPDVAPTLVLSGGRADGITLDYRDVAGQRPWDVQAFLSAEQAAALLATLPRREQLSPELAAGITKAQMAWSAPHTSSVFLHHQHGQLEVTAQAWGQPGSAVPEAQAVGKKQANMAAVPRTPPAPASPSFDLFEF